MDYTQYFDDSTRMELLDAMESLSFVSTADAFLSFTRDQLQKLLPHNTSACGIGKIKNDGYLPRFVVKHNYPSGYYQAISRPDGSITTPMIARWIETRAPQLFESQIENTKKNVEWVQLFKEHDLQNIAAYGVIEAGGQIISHFNFFRVEAHLKEQHNALLKLLVPHMHVAMLRVAELQSKEKASAVVVSTNLTSRQMETLELMYRGKTNWEISKILGVSERTAKFHVEEIIHRLQAVNRTDAVSKARELNL